MAHRGSRHQEIGCQVIRILFVSGVVARRIACIRKGAKVDVEPVAMPQEVMRELVGDGEALPFLDVTFVDADHGSTFEIDHKASHKQEEWVRGDVSTQSIENVWSLLDRSVIGSFHQISTKHLPAYLDEIQFRFNNRQNPFIFRDVLLRMIDTDALRYAELIQS